MTSLLRSGYNALATPAVPATATLSAAGTLPVTGTAGLTSTYGCPCGDHTEALSGLMNRLRQVDHMTLPSCPYDAKYVSRSSPAYQSWTTIDLAVLNHIAIIITELEQTRKFL